MCESGPFSTKKKRRPRPPAAMWTQRCEEGTSPSTGLHPGGRYSVKDSKRSLGQQIEDRVTRDDAQVFIYARSAEGRHEHVSEHHEAHGVNAHSDSTGTKSEQM